LDKGSNRVQRVDVREVVWGRCPFLEEEEKEEDREAKKAGCSPWKREDIVALVTLDGTSALADMGAVAGNEVFVALKRGES
jgi:hypothetical protein